MDSGFENIQNVLQKLLKTYHLEKDVKKELLFENWENIIGKDLADKCKPLKLEDKILFLRAKNSVWRNELILMQKDLLNLVQNKTGDNIIKKLRFL